MKTLRHILALSALLLLVTEVDARPRRRRVPVTYSYSYAPAQSVGYYSAGNPQAVAQQKASRMAAMQYGWHLGGSFGGASYEGVGVGATAAQALNNCCFTGYRVIAGQSVVQGGNGMWYACKLFW